MSLSGNWIKRCFKERVESEREGVSDADATPSEAIVEILGQEQAAFSICGSGKNDSIPNHQLMVCREVGCGQHDRHRGFNQPECIAPAKDFQPGLNARPTPFADENIIKFTESLDGQESAVIGKALKDGERLLLSLWTIATPSA